MKLAKHLPIIALAMASPTIADEQSNKIITNATNYTLQIHITGGQNLSGDEGGPSKGTAFIVNRKKGWIATNAHVSSSSPTRITVAFKDNAYFDAHRIYVDNYFDLAILEVPTENLPPTSTQADLECDALPKPGQQVIAFGNPGQLEYTATQGIVSGLRWFWPDELIQSDVIIKHGNSGGPLIDRDTGKVIGINTRFLKTEEDPTPTTLSIPITHLCKMLEILKSKGDIRYRQFRASFAEGPKDALPIVASVYDKSEPFKVGDTILGLRGRPQIRNFADLTTQIRGETEPVSLDILRDGKKISITADTYPEPEVLNVKSIYFSALVISNPWKLDRNDGQTRNKFILDDVNDGSEFKFIPNDYGAEILTIDNKEFETLDDLYEYLKQVPLDQEVHFITRSNSDFRRYQYRYRDIVVRRGQLGWILANEQGVSFE